MGTESSISVGCKGPAMPQGSSSSEGTGVPLITIIGKTLFASCVCAIILCSNEATAIVTFRLSGTVIEAEAGTLPLVGDAITGFVKLTDEAVASSPPGEFALGNGDVLDIFIQFGPYRWDLARPSVHWSQ